MIFSSRGLNFVIYGDLHFNFLSENIVSLIPLIVVLYLLLINKHHKKCIYVGTHIYNKIL